MSQFTIELDSIPTSGYILSIKSYDKNILEQRGYKNVYRIIHNIKNLSKQTYVNVGLVLDNLNVDRVEKIIDYILNLGVDDIKISISTKDNVFPKFSDKDYSSYPILNYRVNRFRQGFSMRGLAEDLKCHLVKNDVSIMGNYHYPCLVYARESGDPIGELGINTREDRLNWFYKHTPIEDPICKKYCMDFKCEYNRSIKEPF